MMKEEGTMKNMYDYDKLLCNTRRQRSSMVRASSVEDFYSDRSRIIYCSSFRRLQHKAQVFSLEPNSSVRTRLTHSLEVADIGRTLANKIGQRLFEEEYITEAQIPQFVAIVENACLLHDIGNPPFGHFGEAAICAWAREKLVEFAKSAGIDTSERCFTTLVNDFYEFDGNPQGFRIISQLHCERDEFSLNLTYATLMCALKYTRIAGVEGQTGITKKAGYFCSEKDIVESIRDSLGINPLCRYPLTYIMEAADDIAYCLSDIGDGIEKRIIKADEFLKLFADLWKKENSNVPIPVAVPDHVDNFNLEVSIKWTHKLIQHAVDNYFAMHDEIFRGTAPQLINGDMEKVLDTIKAVSRKCLYRSDEAENIELTGYSVITGLLRHFSKLIVLPYNKFQYLVDENLSPQRQNMDLEWRLFNRIGNRYVKSYRYQLNKHEGDKNFVIYEWWLRVHMIIDHINGMTDSFALATYQMLEGIKVPDKDNI